jgi:proteasome lid subunit RPN8/RPN11
VLTLSHAAWTQIVGHAYDGLPDEACGLLAADPATGEASAFYPCRNAAASSRIYALDPREYMRVEDDADGRGLVLVGVVHSHTHTEAYPSPTDVDQAISPDWHYVIVSLKRDEPALRSYRIVDATVTEEEVAVTPR